MHPLIARFLDLEATVAVLEKGSGAPLDPDEAALVAQGARTPADRAAILAAKGKAKPSSKLEERAIVLLTRAATTRLEADAALGPKVSAARAALTAEGATVEEADGLLAQVLLEEAFGDASDPSTFDAEWVSETLESLVPLSKLSAELVDDWLERFAKGGPAKDRALRLTVAETLLEAAWSSGPQPIGLEHLDDALDELSETVAPSELPTARASLGELIVFLAGQGVVGPRRLERLTRLLESAAHDGAPGSAEEVDDEGDEAEDP